MDMMRSKRGIGALVAVVLIILITVASVTIIWSVIIPLVSDTVEFTDADVRLSAITSDGYTTYSSTNSLLSVQILSEGRKEADRARIIISTDKGQTYSEIVDAPGLNQRQTYYYSWPYANPPLEVSVAPIVTKNGNDKEGLTSTGVAFSSGTITRGGLLPFGGGGTSSQNLIAYWSFDAQDARDDSGNGHNGTSVGGVVFASSGSGYAASFDGVDDYIDVPASSEFDLQNMTISAWVYSDNFNRDMFIFEKGFLNTQYSLFFNPGALLYFRTYHQVGVPGDLTASSLGVSNGNWHHIVATYDGFEKKIYIDGAENVSVPYTETILTGLGWSQRIGAWNRDAPLDYQFDGMIDELKVFGTSFTDSQVLELFNEFTPPPVGPQPIAYWDFDEGGGSMVNDVTGGGRDGIITGASWVGSGYGGSGDALSFDGAGDFVDIGGSPIYLGNHVSVSLWQYGDVSLQPYPDSIFFGSNSTHGINTRVINAHLPWSDGVVYWDAGGQGGVGFDRISNLTHIQGFEGQWNHWVFTKDAVAGEMKMYLNGVEWQGSTGATTSMDVIDAFKIGSLSDGSGNYYAGYVDEFKIYNVTLTPAQVTVLYNS